MTHYDELEARSTMSRLQLAVDDGEHTDAAAAALGWRLAQGDVRLLETEVGRRLLASRIPARLGYVAPDGTPRVLATRARSAACLDQDLGVNE